MRYNKRYRAPRRFLLLAATLLTAGASSAMAQQQPVAGDSAAPDLSITTPAAPNSQTIKPFDTSDQPAPALKLPSGLATERSQGNLPGQDLTFGADASSGQALRLSPADADSYFNSKDYEQSLEFATRPAHGGKTSATQQFGKAGEALLGNLAVMGIAAAINGHLPDSQ